LFKASTRCQAGGCSLRGCWARVAALLERGTAVDGSTAGTGETPLLIASALGHTDGGFCSGMAPMCITWTSGDATRSLSVLCLAARRWQLLAARCGHQSEHGQGLRWHPPHHRSTGRALGCGAGAAVDQSTENGCTPLYLSTHNFFIYNGCTPLHLAAQQRHKAMVEPLIDHGAQR
jgi:Ankyrin repeat